ncbi:unnamed protein product [Rotaria magnacalcarata]|uniref:Uncharacterized protein n=2 Tax=Rotaria magnacalcarata TaxID=392030 RepID=A0A818ZQR9_9BILA|nr:unnamed protein product [Rotaria magnacalcarata]CAF4065948.1 unnamed protein product [Rotaria magnacalcarata]CAF4075038.1 unnamed protein product [Rotaria magnacalcarata]CAF4173876.1 unnamed protein product [Rotaria magnacalcarata]CAF4214824.1 unnamed protein product [Rotaria magnacalcarata]
MNEQKRSTSGVIQLSLITSDNHLSLKILQVKGIQACSSSILVKMTLIPDRKPLECHTRAVSNISGSGIFNEKFTFEINNDDINKRLCFSVYNYEQGKNQFHFQGCLSFGIRNTLKKQKIRGWFYLLQEDIGELRHKQVSNHDEKRVTKINRDIVDLEEHQVCIDHNWKQFFIISRGSTHSFGFTVVGDSPTFIGKVSENSAAALCGLKSGDYIVKVNGQNVSRAQQRTVSNLIKHAKHSVTLDIHRYPSVPVNRDFFSLVSSTDTVSTENSSTCSDLSISCYNRNTMSSSLSTASNRQFVDLAQLGHYIEPKPFIRQTTNNTGKPFYQMTNSSVLAVKGSPTNTFV